MAKEIERKFLVREEILLPLLKDQDVIRTKLSQFYLVSAHGVAVRLRRDGDGDVVITVKHGGDMISTNEHEFPVSPDSYDKGLPDRVGHEIVKTRHYVWHGEREWEVDVFEGALDGLIVAELECDDAAEVTDLPEWVGEEVTYDPRYKNAVLAVHGLPVRERTEDIAERIASNTRVLAALSTLSLGPELDEALVDAMAGTDKAAHTGLRSDTFNPFSSQARIGMGILDALDPNYWVGDVVPDAMDAAGTAEALMFAPGDAVFASGSRDAVPGDAGKGDARPAGATLANPYVDIEDEILAEFARRQPYIDQSLEAVTGSIAAVTVSTAAETEGK